MLHLRALAAPVQMPVFEEVGRMVEKRHSTIIIVPHARGRVHKLSLSPRTLKALAIVGVGLLVLSVISLAASGSFVRQRALFHALQKENKQLKKSNQQLTETIAQVQARLDQFEQRTKTLAIAAGVADLLANPLADARAGSGSGGPVNQLGKDAEGLMQRQETLDRHLARVEQRLSEQAFMLSHTPTVAPVIGVITDGFGPRLDPITQRPAYHEALDMSVAVGTDVRAPAAGIVVAANREPGYGRVLKVDHGYGYVTVYGHLERFLVKVGERVTREQPIGRVGMTGRTTGPHLHYEVWKDGEKQNPLHYILDAY
jgi:murein DD-endopeptidase MepM/ murein hydrolase activator NlpD